jgi:hypothetical protein
MLASCMRMCTDMEVMIHKRNESAQITCITKSIGDCRGPEIFGRIPE